jgi:hypothetical protein
LSQFVLDAYLYSHFSCTPLDENELTSKFRQSNLQQFKFNYINAKEKMNSSDFFDCIRSIDEEPFQLRGNGFRIHIND